MTRRRRSSRAGALPLALAALALVVASAAAGCGRDAAEEADVRLVLAAYSAPREAFDREILPAFAARYQAATGKRVRVDASYLASGAQSRAVVGGFEADVVALALAPDVDRIAKAGLITHDWRAKAHGGFFATTVVAFAVRPGNPKGIAGWADLARPGVSVLMPNPKTSGGAMWNGSALYGAALRGHAGVPADDASAQAFLRAVLKNVAILDKGARESVITFEKGVGDVAVTYESEIAAGRMAGRRYDAVVPASTLLIETPAAVVDAVARKHGVLQAAEALLDFLHTAEAQRIFARYGFRSVVPEVAAEASAELPAPADLFRIDALGGWGEVTSKLYGPKGLFTRTWESVYAEP